MLIWDLMMGNLLTIWTHPYWPQIYALTLVGPWHDENETHFQSFVCLEHLDALPLHPIHPDFGLDSNGHPLI
jgi:hypothetical protein